MSCLSSLLILSKRIGQYWCWSFPIDLILFSNSLFISQSEKKFYSMYLFLFYVVITTQFRPMFHSWTNHVTPPQMFLKHFASKNLLPGFYINGTLVENGLNRKLYINRDDISIIYRIFGWDYMNIVVLKVRTVCFSITTSLFTRIIW